MNSLTFENSLLQTLTTAVLVINSSGDISYLNTSAEALLGTSSLKKAGFLLGVCTINQSGESLADLVQHTLKTEAQFTYREVRLVLPDLRELFVDCFLSPFYVQGELTGVIIELLSADQYRHILKDTQSHEQQKALHEIVSKLAHEINNPLGGIRGAAQLLERELDNSTHREYTDIITHEADRLKRLLETILGPYKLPQHNPLNIHRILDHVSLLMQTEAGETLQINRDYDPSLPMLTGDYDQMVQATLNIVRNAWQALGANGEITIRTRIARNITILQQQYKLGIQIDIIDNGCGIPNDLIDKIFYPMISGRQNGTGLGLPIAQSIIHLHHGIIECRSRPGHTCFSIIIPIITHIASTAEIYNG